jgi:phage-related holin
MQLLFQLRLSPSKAEKSNTSAKGLLGIAKKLIIFLAIPSKPLIRTRIRLFRFARDNQLYIYTLFSTLSIVAFQWPITYQALRSIISPT